MDTPFCRSLARFGERFSKRAHRIIQASRINPNLQPEQKIWINRVLTALSLLIFSLLTGMAAHEQSQENAMKEWESHHLPSLGLWQATLNSLGYTPILTPAIRGRLLRTHPGNWSLSGEAWTAEITSPLGRQTRWLTLVQPSGPREEPGEVLIFAATNECPELKQAPRKKRKSNKHSDLVLISSQDPVAPQGLAMKWKPAGQGWGALQSLLTRGELRPADCEPESSRGGQNPTRRIGISDSRALRY